MSNSGELVQEKKQNDQWEVVGPNIQVGSVEIDFEIRGNEFEGEKLCKAIQNALRRHEQEFGGDDTREGDDG